LTKTNWKIKFCLFFLKNCNFCFFYF